MLGGSVIMIIGTIISITAFGPGSSIGNVGGFVQFIVGRVVTGVGNGANTGERLLVREKPKLNM